MNEKRYSRQTLLPEIGVSGQKRLEKSRVLCIGAGGLGSPATLYLAAAGVGTLGIMDDDQVDVSNLQRQILFRERDQGRSKVEAAAEKLKQLNPSVALNIYQERLTHRNAESLFCQYDLVLDGSDNFSTKFLINDAAHKTHMPWVYGAVSRFEGHVAFFRSSKRPCYRCLYPSPPRSKIQNCSETGILGSVVGVIGTLQATLALQYLIAGEDSQHPLMPMAGQLMLLDLAGTWQTSHLTIPALPQCPTCSRAAHEITLHPDEPQLCQPPRDQNPNVPTTTSTQLQDHLKNQPESLLLVDVRDWEEWQTGHIPHAIHWPLSRIIQGEFPQPPRSSSTIVVYCQTGRRSAQAAQLWARQNVNQTLLHLVGGIESWPPS